MNERPSLAEIRARAQKERYTEIGNVLARFWARPTAVFGTWVALRLGLGAHQVTALALLSNLLAAAAIGTGTRVGFVAGVGLLYLGFWLDHVDGQVARWRETSSLDGVYFDYLLHYATNLALGFALGFGLMLCQGAISWTAAGFAIALGWTLLSLHNDCRYKAFFQRLKSSNSRYSVEGGAGGRPEPPTPWPKSGLGFWTWPAAKLCEPHGVILTLTLISAIAIASRGWWQVVWMGYVVFMAMLAPMLAAGRIARAIRAHAVGREFEAWFRTDTTARENVDARPPTELGG